MRLKFCRLGGFTLVELLVVVLIIGILAVIAVPQYFKMVERSRWGEAQDILTTIVNSQERVSLRSPGVGYVIDFAALDVDIPDKGSGGQMAGAKGTGSSYSFTLAGGGASYTIAVTRLAAPTPPARYGTYTITYTCGVVGGVTQGCLSATPVETNCTNAGTCLSELVQ